MLDTTRHLGARWLDRIRSTSSEDKVHETQASGLSWAAPSVPPQARMSPIITAMPASPT